MLYDSDLTGWHFQLDRWRAAVSSPSLAASYDGYQVKETILGADLEAIQAAIPEMTSVAWITGNTRSDLLLTMVS